MPNPPEVQPFISHVRAVEDLQGPAGRLEALLNTGSPDAPYTAILCHPHPPSGGTMHNKVVYHAMKAFTALGIPVLRFNFRGTGLSEGHHDHGHGEQNDVRAGLSWLEHNFKLPTIFAGFSFGANVGMRACCGDVRVRGMIGLGLPVQAAGRDYTYGFLPKCNVPKLFISGSQDEFAPPDVMRSILARAEESKRLVWIEGADHFFQGVPTSPRPKLDQMQTEIRSWLASEFRLA